jgi:hypothetical protein
LRAARAEALDLFSKWRSEGTLLECRISLPGFTARFRGRLSRFTSDEVRFASYDNASEFAASLQPGAEFGYREAAQSDGTLAVFFRIRDTEPSDFMSFTEVQE